MRIACVVVLLTAALAISAPAPAEPRAVDLVVHGGVLPADDRVIRVRQGDEVTLRLATDRTRTIHLHGYDIEKEIRPGPPTLVRFTARATGRFPIEVHGTGEEKERTLGYLEVHPR